MIDAILANPVMRGGGPIFVRMSQVGGPDERRKLVRRWDEPKGPSNLLPWILLNPSTADANSNDQTVLRMIHFTWTWGFDGLVLYNVYPFRTPSPKECAATVIGWDKRQDWWVRDAIWDNHRFIATELTNVDAAIVAWGAPSEPLGFETVMWAEQLFDTINDPDGARWHIGTQELGRARRAKREAVHGALRGFAAVMEDRRG